MAIPNDFLQARIDSLKLRIVAYEDAMIAISSGAIQEYKLDTGQTETTVKKSNIKTLQDTIDAMMNQLSVLCARLGGGGTVTVVPSW